MPPRGWMICSSVRPCFKTLLQVCCPLVSCCRLKAPLSPLPLPSTRQEFTISTSNAIWTHILHHAWPPLVQKIAVKLVCNLFTKMHAVPLLENRCCARCCRKKALKVDAAPNLNEPRDPRERIPKVTQEASGRHEGWTQISWGPANAVVSGLSSLLSSSPLRQPVNEMELITPAAAPALL